MAKKIIGGDPVRGQAQFVPHTFSVKNDEVAQTLKRILEDAGRYDPRAQKVLEQIVEQENEFNATKVSWPNLQAEIMRTIEMLHDRYNEGKLSILDYEEKKDELLGRL